MNRIQNLIFALLGLALFASACSDTGTDIPAVATSNASQSTEGEQRQAAALAQDGATEAFCAALDDLVQFPFNDARLGGEEILTLIGGQADAVADAVSSHREVASLVPDDAPNIVASYFRATAELPRVLFLTDDTATIGDDGHAVIGGTTGIGEVQPYVDAACPDAPTLEQPFDPIIRLDLAGSAEAGSTEELCMALDALEPVIIDLIAGGGADEVEIPAFQVAQDLLADAVTNLPAGTEPNTTAYLRAYYLLSTSVFVDKEGTEWAARFLGELEGRNVAEELSGLCPDVNDPMQWLIAFPEAINSSLSIETDSVVDEATTSMTVTDDVTDSVSDDSGSSFTSFIDGSTISRQSLPLRVETSMIGDISIEIRQAIFARTHTAGTGRDTDEITLELELSFDRSHEFTAADMTLIAPDTTVFVASTDQAIALDDALVIFAIDRDVTELDGWTLQITDVAIQL